MRLQLFCQNNSKRGRYGNLSISIKTISLVFALLITQLSNAQTGTWTKVVNNAPHQNMGVMLLLTDGTVICHNTNGGGSGTGWDRLTPNASGSYVNGTWTSIASMNYDRLFFPTQVLQDGRVFAAGGEYGAGATRGEVYNPATNTWTNTGVVTGGQNIYDGNSEILANNTVLVGLQNGNNPSYDNLYYNPSTNVWSTAPINVSPYNHDEAAWLKLPDYSILFVGIGSTKSCRFIQSSATWVVDGTVPVNLFDTYGLEQGGAYMLPNGKAIFFGATQHNAIYTPTGNTTPGTWTAAADFPTLHGTPTGQTDAPGAMMINGHILLAVSPVGTSNNNEFNSPVYFVEYNYLTNTFTQVKAAIPGQGGDSLVTESCYQVNMLDLPDGNVLVSVDQASYSNQYFVYTPNGSAIAQGKPTINSIYQTSCGSYFIRGKLFNGISEGAGYGDDWQMSTNYPIVRLTNGTNVYYAKTSNWNRIGAVQTDSLEDTATFVLPTIPAGTYSLVVVVNGFPSNPTLFTTYGVTASVTAEVSCNGGTNGNATATAQGGNTPYTYKWANSSTTVSTNNPTGAILSAGTYTVTITDKIGCTTTASVTITQPNALAITIASHTNASCSSSGSATANAATGGTSPYTYLWSPGGGTNLTKTGLSAGTYTITATDNHGCTATASVGITSATTIRDSVASISYPLCNGGTGSATIGYKNGTAPYTFTWSPNSNTTASASGLSAGTYTVTVNDKNNCPSSVTFTMTQPTAIAVNATVVSNVNCNGGNTGSASAAPTGGTTPYTYAWSGGGSNSTKTGLTAGTFTVTVTDKNGCNASATVSITQPTLLTVTANTTANVSCNGGTGGSVSSTPAGGTTPYTYSWSGGGTNSIKTGLSAATYTITVTDNKGCTATASTSVTQPSQLTVTANVTANVSCNGGSNGSVSSSPSGGTNPYTYVWSGGGTNSTKTGLSSGTYTITITDGHGCTATASAAITQPAQLTVTASTTAEVSCNGGSNGSVSSTPAGGTNPYTYSWSGGGTNSTKTGLSIGTYTITVTDKNGCTATASTAITQPTLLTVTATTTANVSCGGGNNGSVSSTPSGGTNPYTYSWTGGSTKSTETGLSAGNYTITVTDKNGCTATASTAISQPTQLTVTATTIANVSCNGGSNGSVSSTPSGGTNPYTYAWSGGGTNSTKTGLSSGTYTITVTDNHGCTATASTAITQPAQLTVISNTTAEVSCSGGSNGSVSSTPVGGTNPYTYSWSGGGSNSTKTGLSIGTYTVTVTDNNGCTATASTAITQPTLLTVTANTTANVNCSGGATGSVSSTPSGGTSPYTYSWTGGSTISTETGLSAGTYTITVTDKNGCTATASTAISQPSQLTVAANTTANVNCNGGNNGSVSSTPSGGASPYTYSWTGGSTISTETGLSAGTYIITLTDNNGCTATASATITQPNLLTVTANITSNVSCNGGNNGSVSSTSSGGTNPYTYSWTGGSTNSTETGLSIGSYTVTVTDNNGCSATASATITQPLQLTVSANTTANVNCNGGASGSVSSSTSGGTTPYTYSWTGGGTNSSETGLSAGTYIINVTDNNGCVATASTVITQPNLLTVSANVTANVNCNGANDGSISASASGGTASYTYLWSPSGATNVTLTGASAGCYTVTVTDSNGCTATATSCVTQPAIITVTPNVTANVSCNGGNNGSVSSTPSGGVSPYTYSWTGGSTNATETGLSAGTYTITITDINGCTSTSSATVTQPSALSVSQGNKAASIGNCDGSAWAIVSGGTPGYSYKWSPGGATTDTITKQCAGSYCCKVTDKNGCLDSVCVTIVTGIQELNNASSIKVYPDPNTGNFTITGLIRGQVIEIYDYVGRKLSSAHADNETMHFNISNYANGIYLIRIQNTDGSVVTQKKMVKTN